MSDDGSMADTSLLDYRMPTSLDIPMIDTVAVEVPSEQHPFGVRGVGEANIIPPPAAIANAIHNAVGVRMHELPMKTRTLCCPPGRRRASGTIRATPEDDCTPSQSPPARGRGAAASPGG
jgi:hypothetical protein